MASQRNTALLLVAVHRKTILFVVAICLFVWQTEISLVLVHTVSLLEQSLADRLRRGALAMGILLTAPGASCGRRVVTVAYVGTSAWRVRTEGGVCTVITAIKMVFTWCIKWTS